MGNPRWTRVAEQIHVIVAELIERRIKDPRLGFVTVTDVRMTGDGREASVYYTVLGTDEEKEDTADALEAAKGMIRSQVGRQTGLKFTPTITFVADSVPVVAAEIDELLQRTRAADAARAAQASTSSYAGDPDPYRKPAEESDEGE